MPRRSGARSIGTRLVQVQARKQREVSTRREEHTVSLVGYTNAGKSTLMNALTGASVLAEDKLFSTLDTRTRQWRLSDWGRVLLSDTVGFIRDLPHHLVASFKATLEEARQAKLLLHVVDASSPHAEDHIRAVQGVLAELGCDKNPTLLVLNKIDRVTDPSVLHVLEKHHPRSVEVSAAKNVGMDGLRDTVIEMLSADFAHVTVDVSAANGKVLSYLSAHADVYRQEFHDNRIHLHCYLPRHLVRHIQEPDVQIKDAGPRLALG